MDAAHHRPPRPDGLVATIVYDGLATFEFAIAVEVFALPRPEFDFPWYRFRTVSAEGRRVRATGGIVVEAQAGLEALAEADTIVLPGWRAPGERPPDPLLAAVAAAVARGARCLSICSGVFVPAAAGLLSGRRATTHFRHMDALARLHPDVTIERDVLYVDEGAVITSAGSSAGIDAAIHLVRRDHGSAVANRVARRMVMPPHREGGQAQYVEAPVPGRPGRGIGEAMAFARARLSEPLTVAALAGAAAMGERTFLRRFREGTGTSPAGWLTRERIARARELLETTDAPLSSIAEACGYRSPETFRAAFRRLVGLAPAAYRARFRRGP